MKTKARSFQMVMFVSLALSAGVNAAVAPVHADPGDLVDELVCTGLKWVGFTSPVVALPGVGPAANQGLALQAFDDGDVGLFLLQDDDSLTNDDVPHVYDYIMSGYTYREVVYCDDVVCPAVEEVGERVKPLDDEFGSFVSLVELAEKAGCLDVSQQQTQTDGEP